MYLELMKSESQYPFKWVNRMASLGEPFVFDAQISSLEESKLSLVSKSAHALIDPNPWEWTQAQYAGIEMPVGAAPKTSVYAGHQFGHYVPRLGDGRAVLIGEIESSQGNFELQFKGSGLSPFSRMGDGKAVLRSSLREFLMSEHMAALGVPTTRALSLVSSQEWVQRESFEKAALVLRLAPSFLRFGHLEYFYHRSDHTELRTLLDFALHNHFSEFLGEKEPLEAMLREICQRTAKLIAQWMSLGWAHGVMNTDNMSLLGLSIDYGPFGFVEEFSPHFRCNASDHEGRYTLGAQGNIGLWNCNALAWCFSPFLGEEQLRGAVELYLSTFRQEWKSLMQAKIGTTQVGTSEMMDELLKLLAQNKVDWTLFWRSYSECEELGSLNSMFQDQASFKQWSRDWQRLLPDSQRAAHRESLLAQNPKYVLRNSLAQEAITAAEMGDFGPAEKLLKVMENPYVEQKGAEHYAQPAPEGQRQIRISCSS